MNWKRRLRRLALGWTRRRVEIIAANPPVGPIWINHGDAVKVVYLDGIEMISNRWGFISRRITLNEA